MLKKILKICFSFAVIVLLSSCSLAGSWVYERLDDYLADYFKEFADFSDEQRQEIQIVSEEFLNWFSENELLNVVALLEDIKEIDIENPEQTVKESYAKGEDIFRRSNNYFKKPIISFSKRLTKDQIKQIGSHFDELRNEREEERNKEKKEYKERILENYIAGFDRIGINLREDQIDAININLASHNNTREEWSNLQQDWVEEFIELLKTNQSYDYEMKMSSYLSSLENLGNENFREKINENEILAIKIISLVFLTIDEKQIKGFNRSLDVYLKSINRILSKRKVN
tara:strand:- start:3144 stop:4001 length:858 start_codon:yes stop_codon:yes gene_type:complete